tara:strand:- start:1169 stop:2293 length:1125 start_codon:yes stop_codon:yes gene_type:complete
MRAASQLFAAEELERLAPRLRGGPRLAEAKGQGVAGLDPIAATEVISYDFLGKGGKYSRPFITLAVYDALTGADGTTADGPRQIKEWPDSVRRTALSIETFHKASLVHDDIEDDDSHRYGDEALHRKYGTPTGINIGDYLIGLGYRLISREAGELGAEVTADIIDCFADAHMRLSEGQGAELLWRDALDKRLAPIDALKIYALKTAPAFEAALYAGIRLAGPLDEYRTAVGKFARNVGVAFQILNDLKDWEGDDNNKLEAGGDICGGRPTILWALALENLDSVQQSELQKLVADADIPLESRLQQVRQLYRQAGVFDKAAQLVDKYQDRAEAVADDIQPEELRRLFYYLVDTVLERPAEDAPQVVTTPLQVAPA